MAAPIIQPLVFDPPVGMRGQPTRVTVLTSDPTHSINLDVTVRVTNRADGLFSERTDPHEIQGAAQELIYGPMTTSPPDATITQDPNTPNEFTMVPT